MEEGCNENLYTDSLTNAMVTNLTMSVTQVFSMLDQHIRVRPNHFKFYLIRFISGVNIVVK